MKLFGKDESKKCKCSCDGKDMKSMRVTVVENKNRTDTGTVASIKILGSGCKACHQLYENTQQAVNNIGITAEVDYITDMEAIASYGIMIMPALLINDKPVLVGKVLKTSEIEKLIFNRFSPQ